MSYQNNFPVHDHNMVMNSFILSIKGQQVGQLLSPKVEISFLPSGCGAVHSCGRVHMVDGAGQVTALGVGGSPIPLLGRHGRYSWYIRGQS